VNNYTSAIYGLSRRQRSPARDKPTECRSTHRPSGVDDPRREGYVITYQACVDCGARTWASSVDGVDWYCSPFCHACLDDDASSPFAGRSAREVLANIRQRLQNAGLTDADLANQHDLDSALVRFTSDRWCAYLVGAPGTGKTTQAVEAIRYHVGAGERCRYYTESDLCRLLRPDGGLTLDAVVDFDLVALDEFGSDARTDWQSQQIKSIVDARYRHRRPTIFATNHSLKTIARRPGLGRVVAERIYEGLGGREGMDDPAGKYLQYGYSWRIGKRVALPEGCITTQRSS
jgi:hypothetical protein